MDIPARLRWRCRRGTKELDVVLSRFLEQEYPALTRAEKNAFEELLLEQDPDLSGWLWRGEVPPEQWQGLIARIQQASDIRAT